MERNFIKVEFNQKNASIINSSLAFELIRQCLMIGISDFCICPGGRNTAFLDCIDQCGNKKIKTYFFFEERSAAFFALGRSKLLNKPVAIITTSGTAVGELLPAVMEAYYSEISLLLITADRPKRFKGSGAPQTAEQDGIFGIYTRFSKTIDYNDFLNLKEWDQKIPGHLNVCLEESYEHIFNENLPTPSRGKIFPKENLSISNTVNFFKNSQNPIAIIGTLLEKDKAAVVEFLEKLNVPTYCEGISGIRENKRLDSIRIKCPNRITLDEIDGIIRIGGVPTLRLWRDLEEHDTEVLSISHLPFSGLSRREVEYTDITEYLEDCMLYYKIEGVPFFNNSIILNKDFRYWLGVKMILEKYTQAEQSFFYHLSQFIPRGSQIYLGNSLSIRQWDQYASYENRSYKIYASRGLNGIDGQISTFLGLCDPEINNWAILGDLTSLYDLAAPWIVDQLESKNINIVIVNNGGGKIFSKLFKNPQVQNSHSFSFESFAKLWNLNYQKWPCDLDGLTGCNIIEYTPDEESTYLFDFELKKL